MSARARPSRKQRGASSPLPGKGEARANCISIVSARPLEQQRLNQRLNLLSAQLRARSLELFPVHLDFDVEHLEGKVEPFTERKLFLTLAFNAPTGTSRAVPRPVAQLLLNLVVG